MHLPPNITAVATALSTLSTAIRPIVTPITTSTHSIVATNASSGSFNGSVLDSVSIDIPPDPYYSTPFHPPGQLPCKKIPSNVDPVLEDEKYYHNDEDSLTVCIRQVVELALWQRYCEVRTSGDWHEFLKWGTDKGLVGKDSNDKNRMNGLVRYLREQLEDSHIPADPMISDPKECGPLLKGRLTNRLLDEILLKWAAKETQTQPVLTSDHIGVHGRSDSSIARNNSNIPDNSTHSGVPFRPINLTVINNSIIHNTSTKSLKKLLSIIFGNPTLLNSSYSGVPFICPVHLNLLNHSTIHNNWTTPIDSSFPILPGNLTVSKNLTVRGNLTVPGNLTTGSYNSTFPFLLGKRNQPGKPTYPIPINSPLESLYVTQGEIRTYLKGMDKNIILALVVDIIKIRSLQNKDAMAIFGNNTDTVDRFFASPSVIDRVYHLVVQKLAGGTYELHIIVQEFLQKFTQSFDGTEIPQACYDFPALEPGLQCPNWKEE